MSNFKDNIDPETIDRARLVLIIFYPCTDVLRKILRKEISPDDLENKINTKDLRLNKQQLQLIREKDYSKFDITLLFAVLRNLCLIPEHKNTWGKKPDPQDRTVSANIERIRLIRNECVHGTESVFANKIFNERWKEIFDIVHDLECYLGTSTECQDEVKKLKTCQLTPDQSEPKFIEEILELNRRLDNLTDEVQTIRDVTKKPRYNDFHEQDIAGWRNDDKIYSETHSFQGMLEQVRQNTFTTFVGNPGSGKSATAHHIAIKLNEEGFDIVPIREIKEFQDLYSAHAQQVFVFDDVFGHLGFHINSYNSFKTYEDRLNDLELKKTKILFTCREVIFNHASISHTCTCLSDEHHLIYLHSESNKLSDQDKRDIMAAHGLDTSILTKEQRSRVSKMFPLSCKLFSKQEFKSYGAEFLINPVKLILRELDAMQKENKLHYASLVLMMFNENRLSDEDLSNEHYDENFKIIKTCVLQKCNTGHCDLTNALKEMKETYTQKHGNQFVFIHDTMLEITAHHFGRQFPELMLNYMNSDYIANYIKVEASNGAEREIAREIVDKEDVNKLHITLQAPQYERLAERLYRDLEKGELYNVFGNEALKNQIVLNYFIELLKRKTYVEVYSLFLSEMNDNMNIRRNRDKNDRDQYDSYNSLSEVKVHGILINEKYSKISVRAISWVVYYGHHQILQYLIDQIMKHKETVDDLFRNMYNKTSGMPPMSIKGSLELERGSENFLMMMNFSLAEINFAYLEPVIDEQYRLFCLSCYSGDLNTVKMLMNHVDKNVIRVGKNKKDRGYWGIYPFGIACFFGYEDIMMEILKEGIDVNQDNVLFQPLLDASARGQGCVVKKLIEAGAYVNATEYERNTPLIAACEKGEVETVKVLLKNGADVNQASYNEYYKCPEGMAVEEWNKMKHDENSVDFHREECETPLTVACKNGHVAVAEYLIEAGADVNVKKHDYGTPLTLACKNGHSKTVELLLKKEAKINIEDSDGKTPIAIALRYCHSDIVDMLINKVCSICPQYGSEISLMRACFEGKLSAVITLLKAKINVNTKNDIIMPVTVACIKGHQDIVDELVKSGADVNVRDGYHTLLTAACLSEHLNVVKVLLKAKADVNLNDEHQTPLIAACAKGNLSIVKELIEFGADVNQEYHSSIPMITACRTKHLSIVDMLIKAGADVNKIIEGSFFGTPLIAACWKNSFTIVDRLIKEKADVNLSFSDLTPLQVACREADLDIVKRLLEAKAQIHQNALLNACKPTIIRLDRRKKLSDLMKTLIEAGASVNGGEKHDSPLTIACSYGYLDVVKMLLEAGADVNLKRKLRTPLTAACFNGHLEIVKQLVEFGSDVDQVDECKTPLTAACFKGYLNVVEYLIKKGADVNLVDGYRTPLLSANVGNSLKIVKTLIQAHADVNSEYNGNTPLLDACRGRNFLVVKELIEAGADVNYKVKMISPLLMAYLGYDKYVIDALEEAGAKL